MKQIGVFVLTVLFLLSACSTGRGIEVRESWARPAAQGENSAVYFVIRNRAQEADILTAISSEVAEAAEIHISEMNGDTMQMHHLDYIAMEPGAEFTFAPGGLHIMLVGVKENLNTGDEIEITLQFRNSEDIQLLVPVKDAAMSEEN